MPATPDEITLELKCERALAPLVKAEAVLGETPLLLASESLAEQRPAPAVVIEAQLLGERPRNSGIFQVKLSVTVSDNAEREGSDGARLDALTAAVGRPFMFVELPALLSANVPDFHCHGVLRDEQPTLSREGSIVKRGRAVVLLCMGIDDE